MRKKARLFGVLLMITALIIVSLPTPKLNAAEASAFRVEGSTLVKYTGTEKVVSVPDSVDVIGRDAFKDNLYVEKVVLSNQVQKIQPYAFWGCENLSEVVLGKGVTRIGDYAFANCRGLQVMVLSPGVKSIGIYSFEDCINFTDITIPYSVMDIHETAFDGCTRLVIHCEEGTYAERYAKAFYERQKNMAEHEDVITYPDSSIIIDTTPDDVVVPEIVTPVEDNSVLGQVQIVQNSAFVFIDNSSFSVYEGEHDFSKEEEEPNALQELTSIKIGGVIPKYSIVDNRVIADQAYYKNTELDALAIPDSIEEIGEFAFARSSLKEISVGVGCRTIGYGAFYHCDNLSKISLPEGILTVAPKAFEHTKWVDDFMNHKDIGASDFLISGSVLIAYRGSKTAVDIPKGVKTIAAQCFMGHDEIGSVRFPDTLVSIGEEAFANCKNLSTLMMGGNEKYIKDRAFQKTELTSVQLSDGLKELGLDAFDTSVRVSGAEQAHKNVEETARRLSNYSLRGTGEQLQGSVQISGILGAKASLSGAKDTYQLYVASDEIENFAVPFLRNLNESVPEEAIAYEFVLTDASGISITKLGKQTLSVVIPVSSAWTNRQLVCVGLDRNGQLEKIELQKLQSDGNLYVLVPINYVSKICMYPVGMESGEEILSLEEQFAKLSAPPVPDNNKAIPDWLQYAKYGSALICLLAGLYLALIRMK